MQLTRHTDYALRLLITLATAGNQRMSIAQVAEGQAISQAHLMKIANALAHAGFIKAVRGRGGGITLARPPEEINLDKVVKAMEPRCKLVDCTGCRLIRSCKLPSALDEATDAFNAVLARYTLADAIRQPARRQVLEEAAA